MGAAVAGNDDVFVEDEVFDVLILAGEFECIFGGHATVFFCQGDAGEEREHGDQDAKELLHGLYLLYFPDKDFGQFVVHNIIDLQKTL